MDIIAPNIAVDILIFCLPMFEIRNLHISQRQSIALGSVFLLGTGTIAASGIRLYCHIQFVKQGSNVDITSEKSFPLQSTLSRLTPSIVALYQPVLWTVLEPDLAVICACLPVLRPLITFPIFQALSSFFTKSSNRG